VCIDIPKCLWWLLYHSKKILQNARASSTEPKHSGKSGRYFRVLKEYTKGGDLISRRIIMDTINSGDQYYVKNHLGSTMFLTDASGVEIIAAFDYFPYGKKVDLTHSSEDDIIQTFTGKELDRYDDDM